MNRFLFKSLIVFVLLSLPWSVLALPGPHDPAYGGRSYTCMTCHTAGNTLGASNPSNVCTSCHNGGVDPAGGAPIKSFRLNDYADPFVVSETRVGKIYQSSHKWSGSDSVPQAGALPPVDSAAKGMNKRGLTGSVTCARCHNVHGDSGANSGVSPYLRSANDTDQMCMDCHRDRSKKSHEFGTHPVLVGYTSSAKVKSNPAGYLATPMSNPSNTSAQMKLNGGKIVCTTCHGIHFTDSNSGTFDNHSSAFGRLSTSRGTLLRTDVRGVMGSDGITFTPNICTNCHVGINHSTSNKKANIQCDDCHSGHVEYIKPEDKAAGEGTPNVLLLRRYVNYSGGVKLTGSNAYRRKVFFTTTSSQTTQLIRTDGKGICQACHVPPSTVPQHATTSLASQCAPCHGGTGSIAKIAHSTTQPVGCDGCHGQPPALNSTGTGGRDAGYTRYTDESTTPHASHAGGGAYYSYTCNDCHNGLSPAHSSNASGYTWVFKSPAGTIAGTGTAPTYTANAPAADSTCNNVYCHSNGAGAFKAGQAAIGWNINKKNTIIVAAAAIRCATCHDINTALTTGAHAKHVSPSTGMNYGCVTCHAATVSDNATITNKFNHANGVKNVQFSGVLPAVGSSCTTMYCHSNGKGVYSSPTWATPASGQCNSCHLTASSGTKLATGGHTVHIGATTDTSTCVVCHIYTTETAATHVNGILTAEVKTGNPGCATINCHASITPPAWTGAYAGKDTCTKCHGTLTNTGVIVAAANNRYLVAPSETPGTGTGKVSTTNAKIGAHETHLKYLNGFSNYSTVDYRCESCHGTLPLIGKHASGFSTPTFQSLATKWGARTADFTAGSCNNTYCHNPAGTGGTMDAANAGSNTAPSWTAAAYIADGGKSLANCELCHKVPGSSGFSKASAHGGMVTDNSANQCNSCHGHNGDTAGVVGQRHIDGIRYASGSCNSCHGYPPVSPAVIADLGVHANYSTAATENYLNGGGAHSVPGHVALTALPGGGWSNCATCHSGGSLTPTTHTMALPLKQSNVTILVDPKFRFNPNLPIVYSGPLDDSNAIGKCSNVSCHFKFSPLWAE